MFAFIVPDLDRNRLAIFYFMTSGNLSRTLECSPEYILCHCQNLTFPIQISLTAKQVVQPILKSQARRFEG